ncbi:hypothetical protein JTB14_021939, partial [Gonioctena quinquepunctata]
IISRIVPEKLLAEKYSLLRTLLESTTCTSFVIDSVLYTLPIQATSYRAVAAFYKNSTAAKRSYNFKPVNPNPSTLQYYRETAWWLPKHTCTLYLPEAGERTTGSCSLAVSSKRNLTRSDGNSSTSSEDCPDQVVGNKD